jgi:hypothetical protein
VGQGAKPLAVIHARDEVSWQKMARTLSACVTVSEKSEAKEELIKLRIAA